MNKEKAQGILAKIKQLFSTEVQLATHKLATGGEISVDKLEVGGAVTANGVPGSGDYTLEDGTVVKVDAAGLISEIVPKQADAAPAPVMDMTTPEGIKKAYEEMMQAFDQRIKTLETLYAEAVHVNNLQNGTIAATQATVGNQSVMMQKMVDLITEVVGAPQADPPEGNKKKFSFSNTEAKNKSLAKYQEAARKLQEESKLIAV